MAWKWFKGGKYNDSYKYFVPRIQLVAGEWRPQAIGYSNKLPGYEDNPMSYTVRAADPDGTTSSEKAAKDAATKLAKELDHKFRKNNGIEL